MADSAVEFMRDNTNGGLIVRSFVRRDGCIRYTMAEGHSYLIDADGIETLSRYGFTPRFKKTEEVAANAHHKAQLMAALGLETYND